MYEAALLGLDINQIRFEELHLSPECAHSPIIDPIIDVKMGRPVSEFNLADLL